MQKLTSQLTAFLTNATGGERVMPHSAQDGAAFVRAARANGLSGLILERAAARGVALLPDVASALTRDAMNVAAGNFNRSAELERILAALNRAGIPVTLLKGAALNLTLYDRADLRPMSDVDLLVRPESADDALRCLLRNGCRRGFALLRDDFFPKYYYELELVSESIHPQRIDLHAHPFRPLRLARTVPTDDFWLGAHRINVGESEAFVPRREIMLIHLAAHAAFHGCSRLLWLYDIQRWTRRHGDMIDWGLFLRRADEWGLSQAVVYALERTEALFGPVCPDDVLVRLRATRTDWRDRIMLAHAARESASPTVNVAVNLLSTPGIGFRLGYLAALVRPGRDHLAGLYPWRHPGWVTCAHTWRAVRAACRAANLLVSIPLRGLGRLARRVTVAMPRLSSGTLRARMRRVATN